MDVREHAGEHIREARLLRGWSQQMLADETKKSRAASGGRRGGVTKDTISKIERGEQTPRPLTLRRLAKALGLEVSDLLRGDLGALSGRAVRESGPRGVGKSPRPGSSIKEAPGLSEKVREFERRAEKVAREDALKFAGTRLVAEMEEAIREADRTGAPEGEIADLAHLALDVTARIMAARRAEARTIEEEMELLAERERRISGHLSDRETPDDRASHAG